MTPAPCSAGMFSSACSFSPAPGNQFQSKLPVSFFPRARRDSYSVSPCKRTRYRKRATCPRIREFLLSGGAKKPRFSRFPRFSGLIEQSAQKRSKKRLKIPGNVAKGTTNPWKENYRGPVKTSRNDNASGIGGCAGHRHVSARGIVRNIKVARIPGGSKPRSERNRRGRRAG